MRPKAKHGNRFVVEVSMRGCFVGSPLLLLILSACVHQSSTESLAPGSSSPTAPSTFSAVVSLGSRNSGTHLKGDHEIPPRDTHAQGQAIFKLDRAGTELSYRLIASNIENVVAAHIHL